MIIYKAINRINGKIYIGQTVNSLENRIGKHLCEKKLNNPFPRALRKYGIQSFEFSIIDNASSKEVLDIKEKFWIRQYDSHGPQGYNLTDGGEGSCGFKHTKESRKKMGLLQTGEKSHRWGKHHSEKTRKKMSMAKIGKPFTEDHCKNLSEAHKGIQAGEKHPMFGKHPIPWNKGKNGVYSEETLKKMSVNHAGGRPGGGEK